MKDNRLEYYSQKILLEKDRRDYINKHLDQAVEKMLNDRLVLAQLLHKERKTHER